MRAQGNVNLPPHCIITRRDKLIRCSQYLITEESRIRFQITVT